MSRDFQYHQDLTRLYEKKWITELPVRDMIKFGWLRPAPHPSDKVAACLRFFNVPSVDAWHETYAGLQQIAAFRTSSSFDSQQAAVAAWLRQGEIEAQAIDCNHWDPKRFRESRADIRSLTRQKEPSRFIPALQRCCAESGVAVAIVRAPNGCWASGATRFLTRDKA
jgi:HTH-type transcriptional regulator/antitoxin HigA